jgi:cell division protein FtsI/penicillin-binding protein 2
MSTRAKVVYAVLAIAVIALLWSRQFNEPLSYYSSRSYVQRTNDLIRRGALVFDCAQDRVKLTDRATKAEREWYAASYLQNDVELFNRNRELFGHFFVVSDCQLREINPFLRTIRLPFAKTTQWLGNIEYSGPGSDASLISANGRTIALTRTAADALPKDERTTAGRTDDLAGNVVHIDFAGAGRTPGVEVHSIEGNAIVEQRVKRGQPADVRLLGNALGEGRIAKLTSGDWLHLSSSSPVPVSETFLYSGERRYERLSVVRTRNARRERVYTEDDPLLQWVGGDDGEEMLTFGEALSRSVTNALHEIDKKRAAKLLEGFDIQLSINRPLQSHLDAALAVEARRLMNDLAGGEPFAASVTVMDGKTGEILAAASFPGQGELEALNGISEDEQRRLLVNHNFKRHPIGSVGKPFFYAAAATKHPFLLDLTVAPHQPEERKDGGDGEREVLQFFIGTDYKLWPHGDAPMDMPSAIERSCNKFTVELATLALAAPRDLHDRTLSLPLDRVFTRQPNVVWPTPGTTAGPRIAGQLIDFPIDLGVYMKDDARPIPPGTETTAAVTPGTLDRIDEAPFLEAFGDITGVRTYGGGGAPNLPAEGFDGVSRTAMVTLNYDLRPWAPLLATLTKGENDDTAWKVRAALQSVSPERVNLSLNQVTDFRTEFVSLLLGGSTSLWTNVQLAEALSRLVTKQQVEATMVHAVRMRDPAAQPDAAQAATPPRIPALAVSDEARNTVLRGMQRVILGDRGTARQMSSRVAELEQRFPGYKVAVYSKTGSPTVQRPETKPSGEIVRQLVRRGLLFYDGQQLAVSRGRTQPPVPYAPRGTAGRAQYVAALTRATRTAARQLGRTAEPRTITRITAFTDRFTRYRSDLIFPSPDAVRLKESAPSPFHVVAGTLVLNRDHSIFDPAQQADSSAAYLLCIVKWKGADDVPTAEELQQKDARVITAAFYLDIGPGSAVAVDVARALVPEIAKLLE